MLFLSPLPKIGYTGYVQVVFVARTRKIDPDVTEQRSMPENHENRKGANFTHHWSTDGHCSRKFSHSSNVLGMMTQRHCCHSAEIFRWWQQNHHDRTSRKIPFQCCSPCTCLQARITKTVSCTQKEARNSVGRRWKEEEAWKQEQKLYLAFTLQTNP